MPQSGDSYRHYKGNVYTILCVAKNEADLTDVVVYQNTKEPEKIWVRPLSMFVEHVVIDGTPRARFEKISPV